MMDRKAERRGLGRGLSALMADIEPVSAPTSAQPFQMLPIHRITPNPDQPRRDFAPEALDALAASIREKGIVQPLIVRPLAEGGMFQIVAGERRWRAAQLAELHDLPVIVRDFDDVEVIEIAIIENIQRADLNAIEEAQAYRQLIERFGHTQDKLAQALSRSRSHVANLLRLLTLPEEVQTLLRAGSLTAGHARALITSAEPAKLAAQVIKGGLSVRETERLAKVDSGSVKKRRLRPDKDADTRSIETDLSANLKMVVRIDHAGLEEGGTMTIRYRTLEDLDLLCDVLSKIPRDMLGA